MPKKAAYTKYAWLFIVGLTWASEEERNPTQPKCQMVNPIREKTSVRNSVLSELKSNKTTTVLRKKIERNALDQPLLPLGACKPKKMAANTVGT